MRRIFSLLLILLSDQVHAEPPRVLASVSEIRGLSSEELARGPAAELEGVVLAHHPGRIPGSLSMVFVHDGSQAIFVNTHSLPTQLEAGTILRVSGKVSAGDFAPAIFHAQVKAIGRQTLPAPRPTTYDDLLTGREDSQWVQLRGIIRAVALVENQVRFQLATGTREIALYVAGRRDSIPSEAQLVDAEVSVTGVCLTGFNPKGQMLSATLLTPSLGMIEVLRPAPRAGEVRERPFSELLRFAPGGISGHRVRVHGIVTHWDAGDSIYLTDGKSGLRVKTKSLAHFEPGTRVEALGFPEPGLATPILEDSEIRGLGLEKPPVPLAITAKQALSGDHDAALVSIVARLVEQTRQPRELRLVLESDGVLFPARLSVEPGAAEPWLENGSRLRLSGIVLTEGELERREEAGLRPTAWRLRLRSPADIEVVERPPWWTKQRIMAGSAVLGVVLLGTLTWIAALRRRVEAQTTVIQKQWRREATLEERNRIARELHDTLAQGFAGTAFALEGIVTKLEGEDHPVRPHIEMALNMVRHSLTEARRSVMNLRADALENRDLASALLDTARTLVGNSGVILRTNLQSLGTTLPAGVENNLFRIGVEAITNSLRHANPRTLELDLLGSASAVTLRVADDGAGFDPSRALSEPGHFGVLGLRERARQINARLEILSQPGSGTEVRVTLPVPEKAAA